MLSCIVAAGVLLRIVIFMIDPVLSRDSILYVFLAEKWQESGSFAEVCTFFNSFVKSAYWIPPLFLWLLKTLAPLFPSVAVAGIVRNILTGSALIAILYFLVRSLGGEKNVALLCAAFTAVHPTLVELSIAIQRDNLYLFFCALVFLLLLQAKRRNTPWPVVGAGMLLAAAALTRYETFELLLFLPILTVGACLSGELSFRKGIYAVAILFITAVVAFFLLGVIMETQSWLLPNYGEYFSRKWNNLF